MCENCSPASMSKQPSGGQVLVVSGSHIPERSGLPSAALGVGAFRFGRPLGSFGTPAVGYCSHCAESGVDLAPARAAANKTMTMERNRPGVSTRMCVIAPPFHDRRRADL